MEMQKWLKILLETSQRKLLKRSEDLERHPVENLRQEGRSARMGSQPRELGMEILHGRKMEHRRGSM